MATDGFDKTMIHLSKSAFEDNPIISLQIDETLKDISENELHNTDFTLNVTKTDKYIKLQSRLFVSLSKKYTELYG